MVQFSVCIPVWNDTAWLPRAIASVVGQSHTAWELIIGDNASSEDVGAVVGRFGDPRIRHHRFSHHTNIFENFNRTAALAQSPWIHALGADDELAPDGLATIAAAIERYRPTVDRLAMVVAGCRRVDPSGRSADDVWYGTKRRIAVPSGCHSPAKWLSICCADGQPPWQMGSLAISQAVIAESGGLLRPEMGQSSDFEMTMRVGAYGAVAYTPDQVLNFTVRANSDGSTRHEINRARGVAHTVVAPAFINAMRVHESVRGLHAAERRAIQAAIARSHLQRAGQHRVLSRGRGRPGALRDVARAIRLSPRTALSPFNLVFVIAVVVAPTRLLERAKAWLSSLHRR